MSLERPGRRAGLLALVLVALAASVAAGAASARPVQSCPDGSKRGLVGGSFTCLKPGQSCAAAAEDAYRRSGFTCRSGELRRRRTSWPGAASGLGGSRANPVPLGHPGNLGNGWLLTVTGVHLDATSLLLAADRDNKPPSDGHAYVLVSVVALYTGPDGSHLSPASNLRAKGSSDEPYTTFNSYCGVLPSPNLDLDNPLVFQGGIVSGYAACWSVPRSEVDSLVMVYKPPLATRCVWFALR